MFERLAHDYIYQSEGSLFITNYLIYLVGAGIAAATNRNQTALGRVPYFANSGLIFLIISVTDFIWIPTQSAMAGGYLWFLVAMVLSVIVAMGFFNGVIAIERSRDAFGHGRMAILGFIPLANLILLFKPPKQKPSINRAPEIPIFSGAIGVVVGFAMIFFGALLSAVAITEIEKMVKQAESNPVSQQSAIEAMVRKQGVEATLVELANQTVTPIVVDEVTTLVHIEADGLQLRRTFIVDLERDSLSEEFRVQIRNTVCAHNPFMPLLTADATIREVYVENDGSVIGSVVITREVCGL